MWLAYNVKDKKLYALKIMRSDKKYLQTAYDEEAINRLIMENADHPAWVNSCKVRGKKGEKLNPKDESHCL